MFQRVRIAALVLPGNLPKIHSQDLPSFLYASKRCSSRSDRRLRLFVLERPCSASLESPLSLLKSGSLLHESSLSLLLDGSTFSDTRANVNKAIGPSSSLRIIGPCTGSLFEFCQTAHPNSPFTPAREGSSDIFPRTAFVPHPEQVCILFFCPWNLALLWLQRCLKYLGMCGSVVIDV